MIFCAAALCMSPVASATTTFDPATNTLNIDAILFGGSVYKNVAVTISSYALNSVGSGSPSNNSFDAGSKLLTLGAVTVQGTIYNNVALTVNAFTLKSATSAGTAAICSAPQTFVVGVNACVTPMGQKVYGANPIPAACDSVGQSCWKDSVANGSIKWIATSALSTGSTPASDSTRPMVFAFYTDYLNAAPNTGPLFWQTSALFADTGDLAKPGIAGVSNEKLLSSLSGGNTAEIDWVIGTDQGLISHFKATGVCTILQWVPAYNGWDTSRPTVPCP